MGNESNCPGTFGWFLGKEPGSVWLIACQFITSQLDHA